MRDQAARMMEQHFRESLGSRHPALTILRRLSAQVVLLPLHRYLYLLSGGPPPQEAKGRGEVSQGDSNHPAGELYIAFRGSPHPVAFLAFKLTFLP